MNEFYKYALDRKHDRRPVFEYVLNYFKQKPIRIIEVGTTRLHEPQALDGDGGATIYFCDYISKYGGSIISCDLDSSAIEKAKIILSDFIGKIDLKLINDDALKYIDDSFDLIYLDGSSSNLEALIQLEASLKTKAMILCDDFNDKFVLACRIFTNCSVWQVNKTHQMAIYYSDRKNSVNSENVKEINAQKDPYMVEQEYLQIDRKKYHIVIINAHIGSQVLLNKYKDYQVLSPTIIFYPSITKF